MKLLNCALASAILSQYFPDGWICAEHDIIHFAPPDKEKFKSMPKEVLDRLKEFGVHYNETDGFYGHC